MIEILYHLTIPPPTEPQFDAVVQEVEALRHHVGGELMYLNPNRRSPIQIPRAFFGFHQLPAIRRHERRVHIHHVFNPDPFAFPVLRTLRRPIIYSLTGGPGDRRPNLPFFSRLAAITVADERILGQLRSWGLANGTLVRPGIDTGRFGFSPLPIRSEVRLLVGSAPWSMNQFKRKGIEALLQAARQIPTLRLVFLWRGVLFDEMCALVERMGVQRQVQILDELADVNQVLAGVHAAISLVTDPRIIRPYPHSLMESLAAGKPILVSRTIPMASYAEETGSGVVVEQVSVAGIARAVDKLVAGYGELQTAARRAGQADFSLEAMVASFRGVYERVLASTD
jgi:glycosyltransferase involved in cell wall biosynthesis